MLQICYKYFIHTRSFSAYNSISLYPAALYSVKRKFMFVGLVACGFTLWPSQVTGGGGFPSISGGYSVSGGYYANHKALQPIRSLRYSIRCHLVYGCVRNRRPTRHPCRRAPCRAVRARHSYVIYGILRASKLTTYGCRSLWFRSIPA